MNASVWATVAAPFTAADNHTRPTNRSVVAAKHAHTRALVHRAAPDLTSWKLACPLLLYWLWNWSHSRGACNNKPPSPHASPRDRQRWKDTYALEEDAGDDGNDGPDAERHGREEDLEAIAVLGVLPVGRDVDEDDAAACGRHTNGSTDCEAAVRREQQEEA